MAKVNSDPNVVPLCDILLVLLIIFMVITPVAQKGIDIKLPESGGEATPPGQPSTQIVLTIEKDLSMKLNNTLIQKDLLETELRNLFQTRSEKNLFIRADENVNYSEVLHVLDVARGAGVEVLAVIPDRYATES